MLFCGTIAASISCAAEPTRAAESPATEGELAPFLGKAKFELRPIFTGERFPNIVVAMDGTVLATWGSRSVRARRSENGGKTWGPEITVAKPGFHGGGVLVDQTTGDILVFVQDKHPPARSYIYRSEDHGESWKQEELVVDETKPR